MRDVREVLDKNPKHSNQNEMEAFENLSISSKNSRERNFVFFILRTHLS